ncbi:MAG: glycosyltransferase family 4 protein [Ignavibacteriaceae bacterium]|jgi:glycosyltransferase involved in cell wall biosynthesis|nr:glycosyltransferase family 4 protein [Ignavibacterium sp.]MCU0406382.1 glycosyltransferase family 4 protein [Ignavibacteriaceae bacterium]
MNIGIDARVLERQMSGVGRYLESLLLEIQNTENNKRNKYYLISCEPINFIGNNFIKIQTGKNKLPAKVFSFYWLNFTLPKVLKKYKINIFFSPNNLLPRKKLNCKSVLVVHDLLHIVDKHYHPFFYRYYLKFHLPHSLRISDAIVAVSESTKYDITRFYYLDRDKIVTIYPILEKKFRPLNVDPLVINRLKIKYNLPDKYILYVGVIERRKNITCIMKIADLIKDKYSDYKFVLAGKPGYGFNSIMTEIKKRENIVYLNFVNDEDLQLIYNLAKAFIFPSFYEGFGYPPLEAMQCGIPVLCSNSSSLNEVVGENGFLRDPHDCQGFANDLDNLLSNSELYAEMKIRSIQQAKKFSVKVSVNKLNQLFSDLMKDNKSVD